MANYRLSKEADEDLDHIFDYGIDEFGLEKALSYVDGMTKRFSDIAETPLFWQAVDAIRVGYRRSVYKSHSIYYRIDLNEVVIVRILGRQDLEVLGTETE